MTALPADLPITSNLRERIDPSDPRFYLVINLMDVQSGKKSRAPGIRRCKDCDTAYIDDNSGLVHCPVCRIDHRRFCKNCKRLIPNTAAGDKLCASCTDQSALF